MTAEQIAALLQDFASLDFDVSTITGEVFVRPSGTRRQALTLVQHWTALMGTR